MAAVKICHVLHFVHDIYMMALSRISDRPIGAKYGRTRPSISFSDVCFDYPGAEPGSGLQGVSFTIEPVRLRT
jgi:hypothetical protein